MCRCIQREVLLHILQHSVRSSGGEQLWRRGDLHPERGGHGGVQRGRWHHQTLPQVHQAGRVALGLRLYRQATQSVYCIMPHTFIMTWKLAHLALYVFYHEWIEMFSLSKLFVSQVTTRTKFLGLASNLPTIITWASGYRWGTSSTRMRWRAGIRLCSRRMSRSNKPRVASNGSTRDPVCLPLSLACQPCLSPLIALYFVYWSDERYKNMFRVYDLTYLLLEMRSKADHALAAVSEARDLLAKNLFDYSTDIGWVVCGSCS